MNFETQTQTETGSQEVIIQPEQQVEKQKSVEVFDDPEKVATYHAENHAVVEEINQTQESREELVNEIRTVRTELGIPDLAQKDVVPSIEALDTKLEALQLKKIETSSNYPGDWTTLLHERMLDPITKEKFIQTRQDVMPQMKMGEMSKFDKPKQFAEHYQNQIDTYDERTERIFASTEYSLAKDSDKKGLNLGVSNIEQTGTVFIDAVHANGEGLTPRQKNIIEAHEKGHGLRDFESIDAADFLRAIDLDVVRSIDDTEGKVRQIGYLRESVEIAERMAQLKNYFGFKASDVFTKEHLAYARTHYIEDTGLDNSMSTFFRAVTDKTEDKFIETINKYPL